MLDGYSIGGGKIARKPYSNVSIPQGLLKKVDEIVDSDEWGYRNRGEFIVEAVRQHVFKIKELMKDAD